MHDYFFIKSKIGYEMVMDVEHSNPKPGTPVLSYCKNDPELVHNQLWRKEPSSDGNSFYLVSKLGDDCRLTIEVIISYCFSSPTKLNLVSFNTLLCVFNRNTVSTILYTRSTPTAVVCWLNQTNQYS